LKEPDVLDNSRFYISTIALSSRKK